jgi:hypothetical protein
MNRPLPKISDAEARLRFKATAELLARFTDHNDPAFVVFLGAMASCVTQDEFETCLTVVKLVRGEDVEYSDAVAELARRSGQA